MSKHKSEKIFHYDLNLEYEKSEPLLNQKEQQQILQIIKNSGYNTIALSHTVHGSVAPQDHADYTINLQKIKKFKQKKFRIESSKNKNLKIIEKLTIIRRLNIILTDKSQIFNLMSQNDRDRSRIIDSYDLLALIPTNNDSLLSIFDTSIHDILVLYTSDSFYPKLKTSEIMKLSKNNITFELNYAPSIENLEKKKIFFYVAREFFNASISVKPFPNIIVSSGSFFGFTAYSCIKFIRDVEDIKNICNIFLGFCNKLSEKVMAENCYYVLARAKRKKKMKYKEKNRSYLQYKSFKIF